MLNLGLQEYISSGTEPLAFIKGQRMGLRMKIDLRKAPTLGHLRETFQHAGPHPLPASAQKNRQPPDFPVFFQPARPDQLPALQSRHDVHAVRIPAIPVDLRWNTLFDTEDSIPHGPDFLLQLNECDTAYLHTPGTLNPDSGPVNQQQLACPGSSLNTGHASLSTPLWRTALTPSLPTRPSCHIFGA